MRIKRWLVAAAALLPLTTAAQWAGWDYDFDQEKKEWKEIQAQIPPYPKADDLIPFDLGPTSGHKFFIDAKSLSVGEDGVTRYTLLVKTSGGATNVSFEGIRCEAREQRVYAFGRPNGEWSRARDSKWKPIIGKEVNGHHYMLHMDYFCSNKRYPVPVAQVIKGLKAGGLREHAPLPD